MASIPFFAIMAIPLTIIVIAGLFMLLLTPTKRAPSADRTAPVATATERNREMVAPVAAPANSRPAEAEQGGGENPPAALRDEESGGGVRARARPRVGARLACARGAGASRARDRQGRGPGPEDRLTSQEKPGPSAERRARKGGACGGDGGATRRQAASGHEGGCGSAGRRQRRIAQGERFRRASAAGSGECGRRAGGACARRAATGSE